MINDFQCSWLLTLWLWVRGHGQQRRVVCALLSVPWSLRCRDRACKHPVEKNSQHRTRRAYNILTLLEATITRWLGFIFLMLFFTFLTIMVWFSFMVCQFSDCWLSAIWALRRCTAYRKSSWDPLWTCTLKSYSSSAELFHTSADYSLW